MNKLVMVAVMAIAFAGGVRAAEVQKGPRIQIKQDRFDVGTVKQGEDAVHVFEFRNAGGETLVIHKVETS